MSVEGLQNSTKDSGTRSGVIQYRRRSTGATQPGKTESMARRIPAAAVVAVAVADDVAVVGVAAVAASVASASAIPPSAAAVDIALGYPFAASLLPGIRPIQRSLAGNPGGN